jgi:RNA polymerase sigma factor (sigma-70 family)
MGMATSPMNRVIQHLHRAVLLGDGAEPTDGELLECFVSRGEKAALEVLVRRHAPMVWGVCRRILPHHDAEDAFQAAFLVLVRKAGSVRPRGMVGNWLYGVAHQTALKARSTQAKRRAREKQVADMPEPAAVAQQDPATNWQPLLDAELSRLPDKYRTAIVLCDLEGKTQKEAARHLGCPEGTLSARLSRGRLMLAKRLARRGVPLSGAVLAAALSREAAPACVPAPVLSSTVEAVTLVEAGQTVISAQVAALAEGVLKAMLLTKLKTVLGVLLVLGGFAFGGGFLVCQTDTGRRAETGRPAAEKTGQAAGKQQVEGKSVIREKLGRVPDPSPELRKELYAFDAYRHGSERKFAELERKADELAKQYPARDDRARIYYEVAQVAGQSDIRKHVRRVQKYARKCLALSRDPVQRGASYTYLGSAAEVEEGKEFEDRRREAAGELLAGYAEMLAQELPDKAPELPPVDKVSPDLDPIRAAQEMARHAAQMAAREDAEFIRALVSRRDTLANQLKWLYRPDPRVHGRNPEGPGELRALARNVLRDRAVVDALLAHVMVGEGG